MPDHTEEYEDLLLRVAFTRAALELDAERRLLLALYRQRRAEVIGRAVGRALRETRR